MLVYSDESFVPQLVADMFSEYNFLMRIRFLNCFFLFFFYCIFEIRLSEFVEIRYIAYSFLSLVFTGIYFVHSFENVIGLFLSLYFIPLYMYEASSNSILKIIDGSRNKKNYTNITHK